MIVVRALGGRPRRGGAGGLGASVGERASEKRALGACGIGGADDVGERPAAPGQAPPPASARPSKPR